MFRLLELIGLLGPVAAMGLLVLWRDRIPGQALGLGIAGALLASVASGIAVVGERAALFSGGEGVMEHLELVSLARWCVLLVGIAALSAAGLAARGTRPRPWPWLLGGWALAGVGLVAAVLGAVVMHGLGSGDHESLADLIQIVGETVQFAALGLGVVVLGVGVAAERGGQGRDAGAQAVELAGRAWRTYSAYRGTRR